jgi:hypothetical protein
MTPEQKKMLEKYGVYPRISGGGSGSDGFIGAGGKAGMVAELLKNLKLNASVAGYGYKNPNSDAEVVAEKYGVGLDWDPNESNNISVGAEHIPGRYGNEDENKLRAKWKLKF